MSALTIHDEQWPVVFIKIDGAMTPRDFEGYIASFDAFYDRGARFSIITWLKSYVADADIGKRVGRWFKETEPQIKKYWVSNAMVSQSAGFRFVLSAVYLIKPMPTTNTVCSTPDEAIAFTRDAWKPDAPPKMSWPF